MCGIEVPSMTSLQAYLYTCSLLRGVTFKVLSLSSYALSPMMLPLLPFLEFLLWDSFQWHHHFFFLQCPKISISLWQTLFLGTGRSHSEPNQQLGFPFH